MDNSGNDFLNKIRGVDKMDNSGNDFLNKIYKDLHLSDEVMHTASPSDTKNEKINKYMERLKGNRYKPYCYVKRTLLP